MLYNKQIEAVFQRVLNVPLVDEAQRRARDGKAEMEQSLADASRATGIRTSALEGMDLREMPFSTIPYYDGKHGFMVSQLADTIGVTLKLTENERKIARTAGLYHDIAREQPFDKSDPQHNVRSAEMAHRILTGRKDGHGDRDFIERVCRYVSTHAVDGRTVHDPIAQALHDADLLESARIMPGTTKGMMLIKKRQSQAVTDFGRNRDVWGKMMAYHGW